MLLRALEGDVLPHLFAMRFFCHLFARTMGASPELYGAYPGVDLYEPGKENRIGEADVLLVFTSGRLVPVECKMRSGGINEVEIRKLEDVGEQLDAPWTCLATLDRASECSELWQPEPQAAMPRHTLTQEHLLGGSVYEPLGHDPPWKWREFSEEEHAERRQKFVEWLSEGFVTR